MLSTVVFADAIAGKTVLLNPLETIGVGNLRLECVEPVEKLHQPDHRHRAVRAKVDEESVRGGRRNHWHQIRRIASRVIIAKRRHAPRSLKSFGRVTAGRPETCLTCFLEKYQS